MPGPDSEIVIEARGVAKRFDGRDALRGVGFAARRASCWR